ncbi:MAG: M15 family metallopeptidase [Clostridia bacterium]|nr:M15 family metallopeptidase [Clostridia bacterium]
MKRLAIILLSALLLAGCYAEGGEVLNLNTESAPTPTPAETPEPELVEIAVSSTATPAPPTIVPTPTATATPDPLAGLNPSFYGADSRFYHIDLSEEIKARITGLSYPKSGAKIGYDELRYIHLIYVDFEGEEHEGELIVNKLVADEVMDIFYRLYQAGYALESVRLVDDYGEVADDTLSMEANNTSAFCYRNTASGNLSRHSYGAAIDINPRMNPYVKRNGSFSPKNAEEYLDRSVIREGMIDENDLCYQLFIEYGWEWGGHFRTEKDYQHFSKDLGY